MTPTLIPILVIIATAQKARRDKLSGIYDYAHGHGWLIHCVERETSSAHVDTLIRELHPAGVITDGFGAPAVLSAKVRRSLPVVTLDAPNGQTAKDGRSVNHDDAACARLSAETLSALKFAHFAAVGTSPKVYWSLRRERAFAKAIRERGGHFIDCAPVRTNESGEAALRRFLASLPRPCGVFAVNDERAKAVIDTCLSIGIAVPDEIAVVGVDNNELICENSTPSITSILPDFRLAGRLAAQKLDALINGHSAKRVPSTYGPQTVIQRASTRPSLVGDAKIAKIREFIRTHAAVGIRVADVVAFAAIPKSTLELHFRRETGHSIVREIQSVRLEKVQELLRSTNTPIALVAQRCGFGNDNYLKNVFKRKFGMTLTQFRRSR